MEVEGDSKKKLGKGRNKGETARQRAREELRDKKKRGLRVRKEEKKPEKRRNWGRERELQAGRGKRKTRKGNLEKRARIRRRRVN